MAKIIQICPVRHNEETDDVLLYALDDEGNVFRLLELEDVELVMSAYAYANAVELHRRDGEV
jgi:hypothetical protein